MLWLFAMLFFANIFYLRFFGDGIDKESEALAPLFNGQEKIHAYVSGRVDSIEEKTNTDFIYLTDVRVLAKENHDGYKLNKLLVIADKGCDVLHGNRIISGGMIYALESAGNPGQFDEKNYYRQKGIYHKMFAESIDMEDGGISPLKCFLYGKKKHLARVYARHLSGENAGIASAMLLGDKSQLDMGAKELYQANGVGHLLAISGLHVSIICFGVYGLLILAHVKRKYIPPAAAFFMVCYGLMTGYGVSVIRAVIMMLLLLFAECLGRSYDTLSAAGFSGIVIICINPYLAVSSGFFLSFGAVFGLAVILPALRHAIIGDVWVQRRRDRLKGRQKKILSAAFFRHRFAECIPPFAWLFKSFLLECFIANLAIQFATLPALLYFFYEYPTYGIFLNMILLPLAPILVGTLAIGGILGLFSYYPAAVFLKTGDMLLCVYGGACRLFSQFPSSLIITGRPSNAVICIYVACIAVFVCLHYKSPDTSNGLSKSPDTSNGLNKNPVTLRGKMHLTCGGQGIFRCIWLILGCLLLFIPHPQKGLEVSFLDVGQGDGIVIATAPKTAILIDGGSTDVSEVGRYRIIPFLKYKSIATIEYMIVTHEDKDHISGQLELIRHGSDEGITVERILLPQPDAGSIGDNYKNIVRLASEQKIPVSYIHAGDVMSVGGITLTCIHPRKGFVPDSCNAYSTTLEVSYGETKLMLTGDLEKNGEDGVLDNLGMPAHGFDLLKAAHHGSKNSTSQEFLDRIKPKACIISCGRKNRYGHPHKELLERLENAGCKYFTTADDGALTVNSDGHKMEISGFRNRK